MSKLKQYTVTLEIKVQGWSEAGARSQLDARLGHLLQPSTDYTFMQGHKILSIEPAKEKIV